MYHTATSISTQPVFLQTAHPSPPHIKQLTSISALGSVKGEIRRTETNLYILTIHFLYKRSKAFASGRRMIRSHQYTILPPGEKTMASCNSLFHSGIHGRDKCPYRKLAFFHFPDLYIARMRPQQHGRGFCWIWTYPAYHGRDGARAGWVRRNYASRLRSPGLQLLQNPVAENKTILLRIQRYWMSWPMGYHLPAMKIHTGGLLISGSAGGVL